jgi:NurA-like 5'-3' nuclease
MSYKNDVVMITLDRPRVLRFGHKAIKTMLALTGRDVDAMMDMNELDMEELEKVLYCGLLSDAKANNETLKLEDMEDLLDKAPRFVDNINAMQKAFDAAFGNEETIVDIEKNAQRIAANKKK